MAVGGVGGPTGSTGPKEVKKTDAPETLKGAKVSDTGKSGSTSGTPTTDPTGPTTGSSPLQGATATSSTTITSLQAKQTLLEGHAGVKEMFGASLDSISLTALTDMLKSPTMMSELVSLAGDGWTVSVSTDPTEAEAGWCEVENTTIVMGQTLAGNDGNFLQTLAHEGGHAFNGLAENWDTRQEYIDSQMKDEGGATYNNIKVQREILAAGGMDIGIAGANVDEYNRVYDEMVQGKEPSEINLDTVFDQLGSFYGTGEIASVPPPGGDGSTLVNYNTYYGALYDSYYPPAPTVASTGGSGTGTGTG